MAAEDLNTEDLKYLTTKVPCGEPYKSHFCLNQGICYQLFIQNTLEYRCECTNNYHGYKCEEKALEGFYGTGLKRKTVG